MSRIIFVITIILSFTSIAADHIYIRVQPDGIFPQLELVDGKNAYEYKLLWDTEDVGKVLSRKSISKKYYDKYSENVPYFHGYTLGGIALGLVYLNAAENPNFLSYMGIIFGGIFAGGYYGVRAMSNFHKAINTYNDVEPDQALNNRANSNVTKLAYSWSF
jgi:hypothetical protein